MEVGVDFGTTKTLAAWEENGEVRVCEPIPSVVWFEEEGRKPPHVGHVPPEDSPAWVGQPAVKRHFGATDKRRWFPQEVAAHVLGELRARLPSPPPGEQLSAVLTAPASWGMRQRAILREAAELAGFHVRRVVPEPEALAVWWSRQPQGAKDRSLLTVNFGGGTIDVAVVETEDSFVETVAIGGEPIGGFDLDAIVLQHAARTAKVDLDSLRGTRLRRFMSALENAKIATLAGQNGQLRLLRNEGEAPVVVELRSEEILKESEPLLTVACMVVRQTRARAGERSLARCLVIGGSARIQRFRDKLTSDLNDTHLYECQGDEIARGALLHARTLARRDGLLLSALPRPVGILLSEDEPRWMLQQGHSLPFRKIEQFSTKGQPSELKVHVVEGGVQPGSHELIGTVSLTIPPSTAPAPTTPDSKQAELPFGVTLDINAEFEIVAEVRAAGVGHQETVKSPGRLNAAQKSVMGKRIGDWVEGRRAARPREAHAERFQGAAREAQTLAGELERRGLMETPRRLQEVAEELTRLGASGATADAASLHAWESLRPRARLLRALGAMEGDWTVPAALPASDVASLSGALLAAAQGPDQKRLTEAQAELASARKAGTIRPLLDEVLRELPSGRGRQALAVLATPGLTAHQLGQMLRGAETPWERYTASCVALVSDEPEVACSALGVLLDWADRGREDLDPQGLDRLQGTMPPGLAPLRALYPEGFVFPFTWLLWMALRPGMGREWLPSALASRASTPLTRGILALATRQPELIPENAPHRLRLARDLACALTSTPGEGALQRLARWREEDEPALARAIEALDGEARAVLLSHASCPGHNAFLIWLVSRLGVVPGTIERLIHPLLERAPERDSLWKALSGVVSRQLELLALDVLLRSPRGTAAQEGAAGYLHSLREGARLGPFYALAVHIRLGGRPGPAGLLRLFWTWLTVPELRPWVSRLRRLPKEQSA